MFQSICTIFLTFLNFITYFTSVLPLSRNHPIDLNCLLMTWFLYNDNTCMETLSFFRETFLFYCNIGVKIVSTLSFCFVGMFSLIYIKDITSPTTSKIELLATIVNGYFQLLINVTMNYIVDVTGSHICYCHNLPMSDTLEQ